MWIYIKVTRDKYELITALGDSIDELAKELGMTPNSISSVMSHAKKRKSWCAYRKVWISDDTPTFDGYLRSLAEIMELRGISDTELARRAVDPIGIKIANKIAQALQLDLADLIGSPEQEEQITYKEKPMDEMNKALYLLILNHEEDTPNGSSLTLEEMRAAVEATSPYKVHNRLKKMIGWGVLVTTRKGNRRFFKTAPLARPAERR